VAVNAPEAGIIKEFLVNEEDTVTVGQDIVRLELGGAPAEGSAEKKPAAAEPKEAEKPAAESKPAEPKPEESKPAAPAPKKETPAPKQESKPAQPTKEAPATLGNREEKRVRTRMMLIGVKGGY